MESTFNLNEIQWYMQEAIKLAEIADGQGEVPVGAVIVSESKQMIGIGMNSKEYTYNSCGHAEINAIAEAGRFMKDWRLNNASIFVTLEPCPMCLGALIHARVKNVFFGAYDKKSGSISLGYNFHQDNRLNHTFNVYGGINHFQCSKLISDFFKRRRVAHRK